AFIVLLSYVLFFFFQAEDGIRDRNVTGVQTCALPIFMIGNVPSYEKEIDKWLPVLEHEDWVLPTELRKSAKTYLDWVGPAVMRHNQAAHIYEEMASDSMILEMIFADTSKWKVEYVQGTSLVNL